MHEQMGRLYEAAEALKGLRGQSEVARFLNVSPQTINNWESRGVSHSGMLQAQEHIGCSATWLSTGAGPMALVATGATQITALDPDDDVPDDMVSIPESRIEFAAGNGRVAHFGLVEDQEPATYRRSWFQKYGINPAHVKRFRVSGDSMEPLLFARDTILVNLDETNIVDGKLYAIRYGDELRVKYLRRLIDGTLILHSVNPLYEDEKISPELATQHIAVIGRVRDRSGTGGL